MKNWLLLKLLSDVVSKDTLLSVVICFDEAGVAEGDEVNGNEHLELDKARVSGRNLFGDDTSCGGCCASRLEFLSGLGEELLLKMVSVFN